MRKIGRVYRVNISGRMLVFLFLFALAYIVFSVLIINRYLDLYFANKELNEKIEQITGALGKFRVQSTVLNQYHRLVNELSKTDQKKTAETTAGKIDQAAQVASAAPSESNPPLDSPHPEPVSAPMENLIVDVEKINLDPEPDNKALRFQFNLNNLQADANKSVSGYWFLMVVNATANPPVTIVYPEVEFKKDRPTDYKKGAQFNIRKGKIVQGRFDKLTAANAFKQAWVYVYSDDGLLLLKKMLPAKSG
ncbi:MAG: hypothetical protein AB1641_28575 [Thermodesulfobacteriota bacterium]